MITSEEIKRRLWEGANELRGSMDASRYKDYMLGLMFYKFLSDKTLETFRITAGVEKATEKELVEEYINAKKEYGEALEKMIQDVLGYFVSPEYLYQIWLKDINDGNFEVQKVADRVGIIRKGALVEIASTEDLIGRSLTRAIVQFEEEVSPSDLDKVPNVQILRINDNHRAYTLEVRGEMNGLIKTLANYPVLDLEINKPSLEEVFLKYYEKKEGVE